MIGNLAWALKGGIIVEGGAVIKILLGVEMLPVVEIISILSQHSLNHGNVNGEWVFLDKVWAWNSREGSDGAYKLCAILELG